MAGRCYGLPMSTLNLRPTIYLTMAVFALHPFALGGWLAFIPLVKDTLNLTKTELAMALLGLPLATVPSLQIASRVIASFGPRRVMAVVFPLQALAVLLPLLAFSQLTLFLSLMVFGVCMAFLQVCLNVYAGRLEKQTGAMVMNRCHGFWALGLMAGPLIVTWLYIVSPVVALAISAGVSSIIAMYCALRLPKLEGSEDQAAPPRRTFADIPTTLIAISLFALSVSMAEGAMADWAAIYLSERLPADASFVGIGVSIYAGALAAGRLSGDWLKEQLGAVVLARTTVSFAILGLILLILPLPLFAAFIGFAFVGAGASVGFPLGVSAVAALDDRYEASNIAIMSSVTICGFLLGPPVIGVLADIYSLRVGLAFVLPGLFASLWLARWLRAR